MLRGDLEDERVILVAGMQYASGRPESHGRPPHCTIMLYALLYVRGVTGMGHPRLSLHVKLLRGMTFEPVFKGNHSQKLCARGRGFKGHPSQ